LRSRVAHKHTTISEHMPSNHRRYAEWTPARLALGLAGMAKAFEEQRQQPAVASLTFEERLGLQLSAIIGMLSAIDRNQCPQSIGTPVRNPRNPQITSRRVIHIKAIATTFRINSHRASAGTIISQFNNKLPRYT
jgi:hypothetical protein